MPHLLRKTKLPLVYRGSSERINMRHTYQYDTFCQFSHNGLK